MIIDKDLTFLLQILPKSVQLYLENSTNLCNLIEVVLDLGRRPEGRFLNGSEYLSSNLISCQDLDFCSKQLGNFNNDNRAGIGGTLHRISCLKNRKGNIIGLTCRVGKTLFGNISIVRDLLESNQSILIIGKPGVGKTTTIREIARIISDEMEKRVLIVDTSNEIAGNSDIPHFCIGKARRIQVSKVEFQHNVMIEAVENHMPEVIIVDEIGTELEVLAARTIAERGVQLIGTVHGNSLDSIIKNPLLTDIIGGLQNVILSDDEARKRGSQKNLLERKSSPTFQILIEINEKENWVIYENLERFIDSWLRKQNLLLQCRIFKEKNKTIIYQKQFKRSNIEIVYLKKLEKKFISKSLDNLDYTLKKNKVRINIYCYSVSINKVKQICNSFDFDPFFTQNINEATIILGVRSYIKENKKIRKLAKIYKVPIYIIKKNTLLQISKVIYELINRFLL
jgi:stage III sporulation protein SpoIIIAA